VRSSGKVRPEKSGCGQSAFRVALVTSAIGAKRKAELPRKSMPIEKRKGFATSAAVRGAARARLEDRLASRCKASSATGAWSAIAMVMPRMAEGSAMPIRSLAPLQSIMSGATSERGFVSPAKSPVSFAVPP
jgi:hypothetical protein